MRHRSTPPDERPELVRPNHGFHWSHAPAGLVLRCTALAASTGNHGFTTRQQALPPDAAACGGGWDALAEEAGVPVEDVVRLQQVHGATVTDASAITSGERADGVMSDESGKLLTVRVADCVPVLLADPETRAVAAVHAGWRGTSARIAARAVAALVDLFGVRPGALVAAVGPSIGPCCYRVGPEVVEAFRAGGAAHGDCGRWFTGDGDLRLDLWRANRDQLVAAGLAPGDVHVASLCTACHPHLLHSYRRDGAGAGRQVGFIRARPRS
jgi:polyphenol oxidase